eukprot:gene2384-2946_t
MEEDKDLKNIILKNLSSKSIAKITDQIFLSDLFSSNDTILLRQLGITHVVNAAMLPSSSEHQILFKILSIQFQDGMDKLDEMMSVLINPAVEFLHQAITGDYIGDNQDYKKNRVLVHCNGGISRSSSIVIAYLMIHQNMSLKEAYNNVLERKSNIGPNQGFFQKLIDLEVSLGRNKEFPNQPSSYLLIDYLADQILSGALKETKITRQQIIDSLNRNQLDANKTQLELIEFL